MKPKRMLLAVLAILVIAFEIKLAIALRPETYAELKSWQTATGGLPSPKRSSGFAQAGVARSL